MRVCRCLSVCRSRSFLSSCGPSRPRAVGASPSSVAVFFSEISCMCALVERMNERKNGLCVVYSRLGPSIRFDLSEWSLGLHALHASRFAPHASHALVVLFPVSYGTLTLGPTVRFVSFRLVSSRLVSRFVLTSRSGRQSWSWSWGLWAGTCLAPGETRPPVGLERRPKKLTLEVTVLILPPLRPIGRFYFADGSCWVGGVLSVPTRLEAA